MMLVQNSTKIFLISWTERAYSLQCLEQNFEMKFHRRILRIYRFRELEICRSECFNDNSGNEHKS